MIPNQWGGCWAKRLAPTKSFTAAVHGINGAITTGAGASGTIARFATSQCQNQKASAISINARWHGYCDLQYVAVSP